MDFYLQQMAIGLSVGMTYALIAIGFTLIFGVLNVVNFAHGEVYTIGAFAGLLVVTTFAPPLFAVLLAALAVGALAGVGLARLAPLFGRGVAEIARDARVDADVVAGAVDHCARGA